MTILVKRNSFSPVFAPGPYVVSIRRDAGSGSIFTVNATDADDVVSQSKVFQAAIYSPFRSKLLSSILVHSFYCHSLLAIISPCIDILFILILCNMSIYLKSRLFRSVG